MGEAPYLGNTAQAVLGKIIAGKPVSATEHRPSIPANVDAALRCALEKLPADRFTSALEFVRALGDEHFRHGEVEAGVGAAVSPWNRLTMAFAALAAVTTLGFGWALLGPQPRPVARFPLTLSDGQELSSGGGVKLAVSPDGSRIVSVGASQLWQRRLNQLEPEPIPGTEGARNPVLSPDGSSVAFTGQGSLKTVSLLGGPPFTVVASGVPDVGGGIDWGTDGMLYFTDDAGAIQRVLASGGEPEPVTTPDAGTDTCGWIRCPRAGGCCSRSHNREAARIRAKSRSLGSGTERFAHSFRGRWRGMPVRVISSMRPPTIRS